MNQKIKIMIGILLVIILLAGGAMVLVPRIKAQKLNSWLDQKIVEWKPQEAKQMEFGAYHLFASDNMFAKTSAEFDMKFLDMLEEINSDTVVLYIRPKEYASQKGRYDALMGRVRADGKKLFVGARFDDGPMTFDGYDADLTAYAKNIIGSIKPDYFGIVIEPASMEKWHNFTATDEQWAALSAKIAILSKNVSPATKTVVDGHTGELSFLRTASMLKDIDIIGFNIYGMHGIYPEYSGYLGKGDVVGEAIDFANSKGKETWLLETWTSAMVGPLEDIIGHKKFMEPIDAKWVRVMTYYAQRHDMKAIVPFFTGEFVSYGTDPAEFVSALNSGKRTPVFYEYKTIIEEVKNNTK